MANPFTSHREEHTLGGHHSEGANSVAAVQGGGRPKATDCGQALMIRSDARADR